MSALIWRDVRLNLAGGWASGVAIVFYLIVASLVPLAIGPDAAMLAKIAGGIAWLAVLLATLLTLERLFQPDHEDGSLEQYLVHGVAPELLALSRIMSHWLCTALPLIVATPLVALLLAFPYDKLGLLIVSLLLGTPGLSAIGAVAGSLAVGVRRAGLLIVLLVLPLAVPILIFGVGALSDPAALKLLAACSLGALALAPFAAGAAIRLSCD